MGLGFGRVPLFKGTVAISTTKYVPVPVHKGSDGMPNAVGVDIGWLDATSAATITLELTAHNPDAVTDTDAGEAWEWKDSGETITGPTGSAAGGTLVHLENVRMPRARLKIVTTAACDFEIFDGLG